MDWNELDDEKIATLNGLCIMNVLAFQKNLITENDLLKYFITSADEPHDLVKRELKRILDIGVVHGLIKRDGDKYARLSPADLNYEADCDDRGEGDKPDEKCVKEEKDDDDSENPVRTTFTVTLGERRIKLEPGTAETCAPSTSAAAQNLDMSLKFNFHGFTKGDLKRPAESSRICDAKRFRSDDDFQKSVAKHKERFFKSSEEHFPYPSAPPELSMVNEEDESDCTDEEASPSRRKSTRKKTKPKPRCPPECMQ